MRDVVGGGISVAVIWETTDRLGRPVVLTEEGWEHVVAQHQDMMGRQDEIRQAIEFADEVRGDARFPRRDVHYAKSDLGPLSIRVVVRNHPDEPTGWIGEVVTAHLSDSSKRGKLGEKPRWP